LTCCLPRCPRARREALAFNDLKKHHSSLVTSVAREPETMNQYHLSTHRQSCYINTAGISLDELNARVGHPKCKCHREILAKSGATLDLKAHTFDVLVLEKSISDRISDKQVASGAKDENSLACLGKDLEQPSFKFTVSVV